MEMTKDQAINDYKKAQYRMHCATRLNNSDTYNIANRELIRIRKLADENSWELPEFLGWEYNPMKEMKWSF